MFITSYPRNVRQAVRSEKKPLPGFTRRLMRPMVLFNQVVQILALSEFTGSVKNSYCLQFLERFGIRCVFVDGDDTRSHRMGGPKRFPEKALGSFCIAC